MRALIQRVSRASVEVEGEVKGEIEGGLLVLLGIEEADTEEDIEWLERKILNLRIFDDEAGVMNLSLEDIQGGLLLVSQFTLHANVKKGNRPSYNRAAHPDFAVPLYEQFKQCLSASLGNRLQSGQFGAHMNIDLVNSGPVTIWMDSKERGY